MSLTTQTGPSANAKVIIGDVPFDSVDGAYEGQEFQPSVTTEASPWGDYVIRCRLHKSQRRYMLGTTTDNPRLAGNSVAFVQLARPTLLWVVDWTAARWNSKPFVPSSSFYDPSWVLLDEVLEPGQVTFGADDRTPLFRISGCYFYGHKNPSGAVNQYATFPVAAWVQKNKFDRTVPDAMFQTGLITPLG